MPYKTIWVAPKKFLRHRGLTIWHTYKDNEESSGESTHYYCTDKADEESSSFDVRNLSTWTEPPHPPYVSDLKGRARAKADAAWKVYHADRVEEKHIAAAIKAAIDKGELTATNRIPDQLEENSLTMAYHDLSDTFWDSLTPAQQAQLHKERREQT